MDGTLVPTSGECKQGMDISYKGVWGFHPLLVSLAWNLKAWLALSLPERSGRASERNRAQKRAVLRMEFKTFVNAFVRLPCQIVRTGRRIVYRLLSWNRWLETLFELTTVLRRPLRC